MNAKTYLTPAIEQLVNKLDQYHALKKSRWDTATRYGRSMIRKAEDFTESMRSYLAMGKRPTLVGISLDSLWCEMKPAGPGVREYLQKSFIVVLVVVHQALEGLGFSDEQIAALAGIDGGSRTILSSHIS